MFGNSQNSPKKSLFLLSGQGDWNWPPRHVRGFHPISKEASFHRFDVDWKWLPTNVVRNFLQFRHKPWFIYEPGFNWIFLQQLSVRNFLYCEQDVLFDLIHTNVALYSRTRWKLRTDRAHSKRWPVRGRILIDTLHRGGIRYLVQQMLEAEYGKICGSSHLMNIGYWLLGFLVDISTYGDSGDCSSNCRLVFLLRGEFCLVILLDGY